MDDKFDLEDWGFLAHRKDLESSIWKYELDA